MESQVYGHIQCRKISESRGLRKFTDKQIKNWISHHIKGSTQNPVIYQVELNRPGYGHTVDCHIQVQSGNQTWVGSNYEGELHQALIHCLQQMTPVPTSS